MAKKKPGEEIYDSKLVLYTTKKQHKKIAAYCKQIGVNMSEWIRKNIDEVED
jgi:hypothetical protein